MRRARRSHCVVLAAICLLAVLVLVQRRALSRLSTTFDVAHPPLPVRTQAEITQRPVSDADTQILQLQREEQQQKQQPQQQPRVPVMPTASPSVAAALRSRCSADVERGILRPHVAVRGGIAPVDAFADPAAWALAATPERPLPERLPSGVHCLIHSSSRSGGSAACSSTIVVGPRDAARDSSEFAVPDFDLTTLRAAISASEERSVPGTSAWVVVPMEGIAVEGEAEMGRATVLSADGDGQSRQPTAAIVETAVAQSEEVFAHDGVSRLVSMRVRWAPALPDKVPQIYHVEMLPPFVQGRDWEAVATFPGATPAASDFSAPPLAVVDLAHPSAGATVAPASASEADETLLIQGRGVFVSSTTNSGSASIERRVPILNAVKGLSQPQRLQLDQFTPIAAGMEGGAALVAMVAARTGNGAEATTSTWCRFFVTASIIVPVEAAATLRFPAGCIFAVSPDAGIRFSGGGDGARVEFAGTMLEPIVVAPAQGSAAPWGGIVVASAGVHLVMSHTLLLWSGGGKPTLAGVGTHIKHAHPTIAVAPGAAADLAWVTIAFSRGSGITSGLNSAIALRRCYFHSVHQGGEFVESRTDIQASHVVGIPAPPRGADPAAFVDEDNDGFYFRDGTATLRDSIIVGARDDCIDSASSKKAASRDSSLTIERTVLALCQHEGVALSGSAGTRRRVHVANTTILWAQQGVENGHTPEGHVALIEGTTIAGCGTAVRLGDNYALPVQGRVALRGGLIAPAKRPSEHGGGRGGYIANVLRRKSSHAMWQAGTAVQPAVSVVLDAAAAADIPPWERQCGGEFLFTVR